jgi:chromosome segregation ATPase
MAAEQQTAAIGEILTWLEQQVRMVRDEQAKTVMVTDQLRRQVFDLVEQQSGHGRDVREVDAKFLPFKGLPEKLRAVDEGTEHIRQSIASNRAELENAMRLLRAEAEYDRQERSEAFKRIEAANSQLGLVLADVAQVQSQTSQVNQIVQTLLERQREVEARVEQFGLRLDRSIEVHRDMEQRVREAVTGEQEDRFDVVFERLQVVGEMVRRNEELVRTIAAERSMREEVVHEVSVFREELGRTEGRINALEESADKLLGGVDKLHGEISLLEGRHTGLGERVAGIRRDIAEVVDQVRGEFAKYNQMIEKQRRKQIQVLEQELREQKFHAFKPPEEP